MKYTIQVLEDQLELIQEDLLWSFDEETKDLEDRADEITKAIEILKNETN